MCGCACECACVFVCVRPDVSAGMYTCLIISIKYTHFHTHPDFVISLMLAHTRICDQHIHVCMAKLTLFEFCVEHCIK